MEQFYKSERYGVAVRAYATIIDGENVIMVRVKDVNIGCVTSEILRVKNHCLESDGKPITSVNKRKVIYNAYAKFKGFDIPCNVEED